MAALHRALGNAGTARLARYLQAKSELTVGAPGDRYEREADAVAERVMGMPEAPVQRQELEEEEPPAVQAQVEEEEEPEVQAQVEEEEEEEPIQAKGESPSVVTPSVKAGLEATRGSGAPLSRDVRAFMEPRFGRDFSGVRVHTGGRAAGLAKQLRAQAFTRGADVYFAAGKYAPETTSGKRLLAHELVHTIHQAGGGLSATGRSKGRITPIISSAITPNCIQKAESVVPPIVTKQNPLVRILRGQTPGKTYPYVNGMRIDSIKVLKKAVPFPLQYGMGFFSWPKPGKKYFGMTCQAARIDVKSQAKIITASKPGPKGWEATVPFETAKKSLRINNIKCARKRGNIKVRMAAVGGNVKWAATVRTHERDHERALRQNHINFLKVYHDYVNNQQGQCDGASFSTCEKKWKKILFKKKMWAIKNWDTAWALSQIRYDGPKGPHRDVVTSKVIGNCAEILVTVKR